ncbi:MAG: heavy metal translocating P-type ATPase [Treponema sp.]|nr:heavy metal translocating P-type ATPase [Treponema sp.]
MTLTKTYFLKGLDCATCAAKIERSICAEDGIRSVTLNPLTAVLTVEFADFLAGRITPLVEQNVRAHEPDVAVTERIPRGYELEKTSKLRIARIIAGGAIFLTGMLLFYILPREVRLPYYTKRIIFLTAYLILGVDILARAAKKIGRRQLFDENFLMGIATIGALLIGEYREAAAVMLFYQIGELFQELAVNKSKKSIAALMDIRRDFANLQKDGEIIKTLPENVNPGDTIIVKPGEKIPLDGEVIEGRSMLDTRALTGEPVPRGVKPGSVVLSGCINLNGVLAVNVTKTFSQSTAAKIIDLVENAASRKAPVENYITTLARYYTPAVVALAALIALVPPLAGFGLWAEWTRRALVFLVISCPCALVISIPLAFFGGIGGASRKGILVKGGNYLEALSKIDIAVFDKTGTLTKGVFRVIALHSANGFTNEQLLDYTAQAESLSNHPIALSIIEAHKEACCKGGEMLPHKAEISQFNEIAGCGISAVSGGRTILAGNEKLMTANGISLTAEAGGANSWAANSRAAHTAGTNVYTAVDGVFAGCITISDEVKPDSKAAIAALKKYGVRKTVMLTGDNPQNAAAISAELELDEYYAGLLPGEKAEKLEALLQDKRANGTLAFVGDGINDAAALARADVGIAMGGLGSDAAIEAADVVLMTDEPSKLAHAIGIARFTKRVVWQNIIAALGIKAVFLSLGALGIASIWEAVFADVGVALLATLNAARVIKSGRVE